MWTTCPDPVPIILRLGLAIFQLVALGLPATAMQSGCLSGPLCLPVDALSCPMGVRLLLLCPLLVPLSLPERGILSHSSPSSLCEALYCVVAFLLPHVHSLGSLTASIGNAYINMFSTHPATFLICSCKYCSDDVVVLHICFLLHISSLPVCDLECVQISPVVTQLGSTITLCIHSPLPSH